MMKCTAWHLCLIRFFICHWAINFEQSFMQFWRVLCVYGTSRGWWSDFSSHWQPYSLKKTKTKQYRRCLSKGHLFLCCLKLFSYRKGKLYLVMSSRFLSWNPLLDKPKSSIFAWGTENIFCINGKLKSCIFRVCKYDVLYHSSISHLFVMFPPTCSFVITFVSCSLFCSPKVPSCNCSLKCSICLTYLVFVLMFHSLLVWPLSSSWCLLCHVNYSYLNIF